MRSVLLITFLAVSLSFFMTQVSIAACGGGPIVFTCDDSPPNPDLNGVQQEGNNANLTVNALPGAEIDTTSNSDSCIQTGDGNDVVNVDGGNLDCDAGGGGGNNGIETEDGADIINITDSTISARDAVFAGAGDNTVNVERSTILARDNCVDTREDDDIVNVTDVICMRGVDGFEVTSGDDTITILRSQILCAEEGSCQEAISGSSGNEDITIVESILRNRVDDIIDLGPNDDIVRLGTGADLGSSIDCSSGFDTILFFMEVPEEQLNRLSGEIALADPAEGSITINGLFYEWRDCELLVNELVGVRITQPIPTLSHWGLIAMVGLFGIVGVMFAVRRRAQA